MTTDPRPAEGQTPVTTSNGAPPIRYLDAAAVAAVPPAAAADAITGALIAGLDVAADPPRAIVPVTAGQLLLMPGELGGYAGVKVVGLAPDNPARGLPRIQGSYLLMDSATLRQLAVIDGTALTTLRTPAVSAAAARPLAPAGPCRMVVFGAGPQAAGHIRALREVLELVDVRIVTRTPSRAGALAAALNDELGVPVRAGQRTDVTDADVVVCATTAARPLFAPEAVPDGALVIAVGSHEPGVLELDPALLSRSQVVVEDRGTALREAGEVVAAAADGLIDRTDLIDLSDLVTGRVAPDPGRTRVFKSVGMGWEDLAVAARVYASATEGDGADG